MANTTARTKQDVDNMTKQERLWDSLNYSYGKKRESQEQAYNKSYSQADRQALSRGMQRSSYNAQNLANINEQKNRALGDIWDTQIADYENRLADIEKEEAAAEQWERQFAESQRQYDTSLAWQKEQAATQNNQWQQEFNYKQERDKTTDQQWQLGFDYQKERDTTADQQWQMNYNLTKAGQEWDQAFKEAESERQQGNWEKTYEQTAQQNAIANDQWQKSFDQTADQNAWTREYQQAQADLQASQWERSFAQDNADSDKTIAINFVTNAASNGGDVSDDLLARAGISREDYNAMKKKATSSGSGSKNNNDHKDYTDSKGNTYTWNSDIGGYVIKNGPDDGKKVKDESLLGDLNFNLNGTEKKDKNRNGAVRSVSVKDN